MRGIKVLKASNLYWVSLVTIVVISWLLFVFVSRYLFFIGLLAILLDGLLHLLLFGKGVRDPFFKVIIPFRCWTPDGWYSIERGDTLHVFEVFDECPIEGSEYVCDSGKQLKRYRRSFSHLYHDQKCIDFVVGVDTLNLCCKRMEKWYERLY